MVKKKPQNDERLPLVDEITDNKTKTKYNGEKKEKENLDIETINNINENITLINSQINGLATKINLISKEEIENQIDNKIEEYKNNKLDKVLKILGIIATIIVPMLIYFKTPSDLSIQNTINETYKNYKADTKEYINEQLRKQIEKIVDEKINNITLKK